MAERLYDLPPYEGDEDYLSDQGLDAIARLIIDRLPHDGFDMPSCQASARGVTATVVFDKPSGPMQNTETFEAMLQAVTVVRTLHANLVAARQALTERAEHDRTAHKPVAHAGGDGQS